MDYRRISGILLTFILLLGAHSGSMAQDFSWGALDMVRSSGGGSESGVLTSLIKDARTSFAEAAEQVSTGALDALLGSQSGGGSPIGALTAVASARGGEYRPDALNYISRSHLGAGYYTSGVWESPSDITSPQQGLWAGQMMMAPSWGRITSTFGFRPRFGRMHKGIDIAMSVGDTVCVPVGGRVERVSYEAGGYGNYIVVKHDSGLETRYAHLSVTLVAPGDMVSPQQPIALSGNTGNSTGPHLHFETRYN
ncbi:MAG: M23 family metallopeptidase, partial [Muribaculaceae bacterium]|nr:M23 family metallopeptidase [Muribaculaceae bacterium]